MEGLYVEASKISIELIGFIFVFMAAMPSALMAYCFRRIEHRQNKQELEREKKDVAREKQMNLLMKATRASISLGEAAAMALKSGHTNGETEAALTYAREVKHEQDNFLTETVSQTLF